MKTRLLLCCSLLLLACGGAEAPTGTAVSAEDLLKARSAGDELLVLDVRTPGEHEAGHVPGSQNIPVAELEGRFPEIEARGGATIVVYCERGPRAERAAAFLRGRGLTRVLRLDGDMSGWRSAGLPIEASTRESP